MSERRQITKHESVLPLELRSKNNDYPELLFADWKKKFIRFDGGDDIPAPVTPCERPMIIARYAVSKRIDPSWTEVSHAKIARGELEVGLVSSILKAWHNYYDSYDGIEKGDIELAAEELGVYEFLFPFGPDKLQEAEVAERELAANLASA